MGYTPLYYGKRSIIDSVDDIMEYKDYQIKISTLLHALVHCRFDKEELKDKLVDIFSLDFGDIDEHFIDGKSESSIEMFDDRYSFDLELKKGEDTYVDIYFIKTNEDLLYITEVYVDFNNWK